MPQVPNTPNKKQALIPTGVELVLNQDGSVTWKVSDDPIYQPPADVVTPGRRAAEEQQAARAAALQTPEAQERVQAVVNDRAAQAQALKRAREESEVRRQTES